MFLIGTNIKHNGYTVREASVVTEGKFLLDERDNNVYVSDTGFIYDFIFSSGLNKDSINMACQYAFNKVMEQL